MIEGFSIPTAATLLGFGCALTAIICFVCAGLARYAVTDDSEPFSVLLLGLYLYALPLMALGIVVGYLSSISREPAIADTLPAVLTLAGGVTVYIYSLDSVRKSIIAGISLLVFTINLIGGSAYGAYVRETGKLERMLFAIE